jgi:VanZ family protein
MRVMPGLRELFKRWGAAVLLMLAIFALSSRPPNELPHFGWADRFFKKAGHMVGYGLLAFSYWHGLGRQRGRSLHAWALAVLYGASDELHQVFVPGRGASVADVLIFDSAGAALALWLGRLWAASQVRRRRNA